MVAALRRMPRAMRLSRPRARGRARLWLAVAVVAAAGGVGGWLWLRDSSLVAVEHVEVTGATGAEAPDIRHALDQAGREMTTLHVDGARLQEAVASYPQVKRLAVHAGLLHRLRITVIERPPVAALVTGGRRTPVAADGTLLRGHVSAAGVPAIPAAAPPAGGRLTRGVAEQALTVVAAAPAAMRRHVDSVRRTSQGLVAQVHDGPRILLGTTERARAKWVAAARVLGDRGSAGASYIDVRLPDRPAAGGFPAATSTAIATAPQTSTGG